MNPAADVVAQALANLRAADGALLIDLEFTCWEESLRTGWSDPSRPAEVIEIGLAEYRLAGGEIARTFSSLVRPRVNPILSPYCRDLLPIAQAEIDAADELPVVLGRVAQWLSGRPGDARPTCGWASMDRVRLAANARAVAAPDPLAERGHIDLRAAMTALYGHRTPFDRDELRALARLAPNARRHRALDDALDLTHFLALLPSAG